MDLNDVGRFTRMRLKTLDGAYFYGEFMKPASTVRPDNFDPQRRVLRTGVDANVGPGTIITTRLGRYYLLADYEDDDVTHYQGHTYFCFEVATLLTWEREQATLDPVTNIPRNMVRTNLGQIRCSMETPSTIRDPSIGVRTPVWRIVTSADVQLNDVLGGQE